MECSKTKITNFIREKKTELNRITTCQWVQPKARGKGFEERFNFWNLCEDYAIKSRSERSQWTEKNNVPIARVIPFSMVQAWCIFLPHTFWFKNCNVYSSTHLYRPSLPHKLVWIMLDCSLSVSISIECYFISRFIVEVVVEVTRC